MYINGLARHITEKKDCVATATVAVYQDESTNQYLSAARWSVVDDDIRVLWLRSKK
jgi:hypothetical protein